MRSVKKIACYGLVAMLLTACGSDMDSDLHHWAQERKSKASPYVPELKAPSVFTPQAYVFTEEDDPFNKLNLTRVLSRDVTQPKTNDTLLLSEKNRQKEELESYPLESMTMVGSLRKNGQSRALVRVNQQIYTVKPGDYLGHNYGQIVQIEEHSIKLREVIQDAYGDWVQKITKLDLQEGNP